MTVALPYIAVKPTGESLQRPTNVGVKVQLVCGLDTLKHDMDIIACGTWNVSYKLSVPSRSDVLSQVRMNDMLSYLLTYKLKGEDVVRDSGIPATIVRPCALTEEPGGAPMIVSQGDNIKGTISR